MDELYVVARRVLLDALDALGTHRSAITLVGAQAIYLRVGEADLAVAPFTTDGDLVIDPQALAEIPPLEQALTAAGFAPETPSSVGIWITHRQTSAGDTPMAVDLLVPASVSPGKGRRAARLTGHDPRSARIVKGLEGALVDFDVLTLSALEETDLRRFDIQVAGPAALLIAKLHKIHERVGSTRKEDKDALDVLRLLRGVDFEEMVRRIRQLGQNPRSAVVTQEALGFLRALFGTRVAAGTVMAVRATAGLVNSAEVETSLAFLVKDLLTVLGG